MKDTELRQMVLDLHRGVYASVTSETVGILATELLRVRQALRTCRAENMKLAQYKLFDQ